ncbi:heterokaryon incompatibility protein-domain-containing protein [Gymnopilus junonius]|uniref:Heterokaryon incompatibility protein-domain-containing protein n=1 Tax=Gymnopilus junonius TaxID=109634 RepID=A0A9P5TJL8_GYMJU|nr:heterokaryon incompatibility protein-domain-containing protein [Gymnopilus junonius]
MTSRGSLAKLKIFRDYGGLREDDGFRDHAGLRGDGDREDSWKPKHKSNRSGGSFHSLNSNLCSTCRGLDIRPDRFIVGHWDDDADGSDPNQPQISIGLVEDIKKKSSSCPFCRLVLKSLGPGLPLVEDGEPILVSLTWNTDGPVPDPNNAPEKHESQIRYIRPHIQKKNGGIVNAKGLNSLPEITLVADDAPSSYSSNKFGMIRDWITLCDRWHGRDCDKSEMLDHEVKDPASEIPHFRLIDVIENRLVHAPPDCKYVALSYVWGRIDPQTILRALKDNVAELESTGALKLPKYYNTMPKTIRDAIQVVRELGLRYLWVDSLCIIQDDIGPGGSKMSAISKMDLVYGAAYLTITAATGVDSNAGLPGLLPGTRQVAQPVEEVLPGVRLAHKLKYQDFISSSAYYTRGWTYQEQKFTKRSLIFIGGQAIYKCRTVGQWREDVVFEDEPRKEITQRPPDPDDISPYVGFIQSYTALSLSYQTDIYNAFAGIARYLKVQLSLNLTHGIPDAFFDWFLLWVPVVPQTRRENTPSWSWSGWIGESSWKWLDQSRSMKNIRKAHEERTWIIWYQRNANDSVVYTRIWTPKQDPKVLATSNLYGGQMKPRFPFDCSQTVPTPRRLVGAPEYFKDRPHDENPSFLERISSGSGFLQFWTVSAVFRLDQPSSAADPRSTVNPNTRLGIFGGDGRELGVIFVNPEWSASYVPSNQEFILLCEGRDESTSGGRMDDEKGCKFYKVMLIERKGDWAERVAVGSIEKQGLDQALENGAVWKEITLG